MNPVNSPASSVPTSAAIVVAANQSASASAAPPATPGAAVPSSSQQVRDTSTTSSTVVRTAFFEDKYEKKFLAEGGREKILANLMPHFGASYVDDGTTPLGEVITNCPTIRILTRADLLIGDVAISTVKRGRKLNAFREVTNKKQKGNHNGIKNAINQGDARNVHASIIAANGGNQLAKKQWPELEETWHALETVNLLDASRAFEAMKGHLMPSDAATLSENGKQVLNQMGEIQRAVEGLGEIENVLVKLDALEGAVANANDDASAANAWTKFDALVVTLSDAKDPVSQRVLQHLNHVVNDIDLSSSRSDSKYDVALALKKLTGASAAFAEAKNEILRPAIATAVTDVMTQFSNLEQTLEQHGMEAPHDGPVNAAKESFHALKNALSASTLGTIEEALPTFAKLKAELWAFGDPLVVEARNAGGDRTKISRIQKATLNSTEHNFIKVYRAVGGDTANALRAAALMAQMIAHGKNVPYSIKSLSNSMKNNDPDVPGTMEMTVEYDAAAQAQAADIAKDAFNPEPGWGINDRENPVLNGASCSTAVARFIQGGAIQAIAQKQALDSPGTEVNLDEIAALLSGFGDFNPEHVSVRTLEHILLTSVDDQGRPLFELVGVMQNDEPASFRETYPSTLPNYRDSAVASDVNDSTAAGSNQQLGPKRPRLN